ncbi:MAG: hypothetical protein GY913_33075 [Proteobacteria bacterium]|nr:hypothetical protein [Pseudomonadota bacterium]MCP4921758.1 hypothetical protein [Pseudomonadota bacterium]
MLFALTTLALSPAATAAEPHFSYPKVLTANGYGVAVFDASGDNAVLDTFGDHLYQQYSPESEPTRDLLYDTYFGVRAQDESVWLTEANDYRIVPGTNVLEIDRSRGELMITEFVFAPMEHEQPGIVHILRVENTGSETLAVEAFKLENWHVGDPTNENEAIQNEGEGLVMWGQYSGLTMHFVPLVSPTRTDCSPNNPYYAVNEGWDLDACDLGQGDDQIGAFQWSLSIEPGAVEFVGVIDQFGTTDGITEYVASRTPDQLIDAELAWWDAWHDTGTEPADLSEDERNVYRQALAFMKMGQVREEGDAYGQILASLPASAPVGGFQHIWNISWVRDGAYAIRGLTAAGHHTEARDFLEFQIQDDKTGEWTSYVGGMDHALSICRIYGNGQEWTDVEETGPNIEFDNFGLYLWAAGQYVRASGDTDFATEHQAKLFDETADVLVRLVDPQNGLITADSSIWERHWEGHQKQFTYTSLWAVRGLREAAWLAEQVGDSRAQSYSDEADAIAAAIEEHLVRDDGVLVGNLEEHLAGDPAMDLAAIDAFNNGVLDPRGDYYEPSMAAYERDLGVTSGPGFARNDDGDLYDEQEWLMIDLRVAESLRRACRPDDAAELEDWITEHAVKNNLIIPELLEPSTADYSGPAPMMGFGSGLYVLQMHQREVLVCDGDTGLDSGSDTGTKPPGGGATPTCGCNDDSAAALLLLPLLFLRRRRR